MLLDAVLRATNLDGLTEMAAELLLMLTALDFEADCRRFTTACH